MNKAAKIEVKNLQKSYTNKKKNYCVPLSKCDLKVNTNEFFVILGESGCGKSTLLRVIAGLESYDFGDILLDGIDARNIPQINKNMSLVSQNIVLFPHKTVYENLIVSLNLNRFTKEDKLKRIHELSEMFHLDMLLTRKPKELSGGQQQRVAVARAMAKKPDICLFDEPLASLDPIYHDDLIKMFKEVQKETLTTFVYCTHNQLEAFKLADKIGILHNRKFEQIGTVNDFVNHPVSEFVATYLNSIFLFVISVNFLNGVLHNEEYHLDIPFKTKINILNKYKGKELRLAIKKEEIKLGEGNATLGVINVTPNTVTVVINDKEIVIPYDNNFDLETKKINFHIEVDEPILFYEGKNIF